MFSRKNRREYEAELLKQTDPYTYYVREERPKEALRGSSSSPPSLDKRLSGRFEGCLIYVLSKYYVFAGEGDLLEWDIIKDSLRGRDEDLIYFDHDYITAGKRHTPFFKPEWSFDTFMDVDYIEEIFAVKKDVLEEGRIKTAFENDHSLHEFIFHIVKGKRAVSHISMIASHISTELSLDEEVYAEYVNEHKTPSRIKALNSIRQEASYAKKRERYTVSIVIPSKDNSGILATCLNSIVIKSNFNILSLEIIIVDNGSSEEEKNKILGVINNVRCEVEKYEGVSLDIKYIYEPMEFNFSKMCDLGARQARYEYLLFLNNDIELKENNSIETLCAYASMEDAGAIGCKLYYPDSSLIQHDGITDLDCGPSHKLSGHDDREIYYFGVNRFNRNVLAVTGACLMIRKEKYFNIGGFNVKMKVSYNDVDLCLKSLKHGYRNILINDVIMYHHESLMRGKDDGERAKYERLTAERDLLYRQNEWLKRDGDPYYSRKLIPDTLEYNVNVMPAYQRRSVRSEVRELKPSEAMRLKKKAEKLKEPDKHLKFNLEKTSFERGLGDRITDYYVFEGWLIHDRRDNSGFDRRLILISENGQSGLEIEMLPKLRRDVIKVHTKAKRARLAGFVCKLPTAYINKKEKYEVILLLRKKGRKNGRIAVWDGGIL